jgi:hypothetical protein
MKGNNHGACSWWNVHCDDDQRETVKIKMFITLLARNYGEEEYDPDQCRKFLSLRIYQVLVSNEQRPSPHSLVIDKLRLLTVNLKTSSDSNWQKERLSARLACFKSVSRSWLHEHLAKTLRSCLRSQVSMPIREAVVRGENMTPGSNAMVTWLIKFSEPLRSRSGRNLEERPNSQSYLV